MPTKWGHSKEVRLPSPRASRCHTREAFIERERGWEVLCTLAADHCLTWPPAGCILPAVHFLRADVSAVVTGGRLQQHACALALPWPWMRDNNPSCLSASLPQRFLFPKMRSASGAPFGCWYLCLRSRLRFSTTGLCCAASISW